MAEVAMQALERAQVRGRKDPPEAPRLQNTWDDVPPRPSELQDLIRHLFAHDDIIRERQQLPDVPAKQDSPYKQTMRRIKLSAAYSMLLLSSSIDKSLMVLAETFKGILGEIRDPGKKDGAVSWTDAVSILQGGSTHFFNTSMTDNLLRRVAIRTEKWAVGFR
jgi:hypothetical protein